MTLALWYYVVEYKPRTRLLSAERSEGSPQSLDFTTAEILRFAQNDRVEGFFRSP
jgi:hypothetical protein